MRVRLIQAGVDYQIRETFESALAFSENVLLGLGFEQDVARESIAEVRERDERRLQLELVGGFVAGRKMMRGNIATPEPEPFFPPPRQPEPSTTAD